jgi:nitroreductase/NAD-dependent dihydropyrimidine dehydrogenase PreA subunit
MSLITVNQESCIKCGLCVEECPTRVLKLEATGPVEIIGNKCIACGHCVAICPKEALDNEKSPLAMQSEAGKLPKLDPEQAKNFIRSRRSIRSYKTKSVEREKLMQLVEVANLAPTGSNTQGISYLIIDDKKTLETIVEECVKWFEDHPVFHNYLGGLIKGYREENADGILRDAPSLILSLADKDFRNARENSIFSLTYLELFAPSLGLGSCWAGILEVCARSEDSPIHKLLNLSEKKIITGCVMVGYPKHTFKRFTERQPLSASFYKE